MSTDNQASRPSLLPSWTSRFKKINKLFLATVVMPTGLAILYFGLVASDVYISESRFVVRSPERQSASPLGQLFKGAGFTRAQDDAYTVQDYILSRDALKALDEELRIKQAYSSRDVDLFNRFGALDRDDSFEAFHRYYQGKATIRLDSASSISTLTVRAFRAEDAHAINKRLIELAETLVNKLNERGRQDLVRFATEDVAAAEKSAKAAALALAAFRSAKGVIDPERQTQIPLQQVAKLQEELLATRSQILQLERIARENPQLAGMRQRAALLEQEIRNETARVTGGERSLAGKAAEFQRLALEKEFADKMLASALSSLEQARSEAQRKQLYIERIVQPSLPDEAAEPKRMRGIGTTLLFGLVLWGVLSILVAGVREHRD